jgi:hypothetical protein
MEGGKRRTEGRIEGGERRTEGGGSRRNDGPAAEEKVELAWAYEANP